MLSPGDVELKTPMIIGERDEHSLQQSTFRACSIRYCTTQIWKGVKYGMTVRAKECQFGAALLNTFLETSFTGTAVCRSLFGCEALILGMSGYAMLFGAVFAICAAIALKAQSEHFDEEQTQVRGLTRWQKVFSGGYFVSKVINNTQPILVFIQAFSWDSTTLGCAIAYPSLIGWGLLCSVRDLQNTITAFRGGEDHGAPFWHGMQFVGNLTNTFFKTLYTGSALVTDVFSFKEIGTGLSWIGMVSGFLPAAFFSKSEAESHGIQSHHFRGEENALPVSMDQASNIPLTTSQKIYSIAHYVSGVFENAQPSLAILKPLGATATRAGFGITYGVLAVAGMFASVRDLINTQKAYAEKNGREAAARRP